MVATAHTISLPIKLYMHHLAELISANKVIFDLPIAEGIRTEMHIKDSYVSAKC